MFGTMTWSQKQALAQALAKCDVMSKPDRRAGVVAQLPKEIRQTITDSKVEIDHIHAIIDACLNYANGVSKLIEIVHDKEQDSIGFGAVRDVLENIRLSAVLTEDQRTAVVQAIGSLILPMATLRRLALDCLVVGGPQQIPDEVGALVDHLAVLPQQGTHLLPRPVLEFIERVALRPEAASVGAVLRRVGGEASTSLGVSEATVNAARRELEQAVPLPGRKLCVLVDLRPEKGPLDRREPEKKDKARYFLDVWVTEEGGAFRTDSPLGDPAAVPRTLAEIRADFMEFLERLVDPLTLPGDDLRIELFLPRELRSEEFDQWARAGDPNVRVGRWCPVAVRCRDRLLKGRLFGPRPLWERHGTFTLHQPPARIRIITLQQAADADTDTPFDEMVEAEGQFCLIVAVPPSDFADPAVHADLIQEAVDDGMAVGLWLRRQSDAVDAAAELRKLVNVPCLDQLPGKLLKLRKLPAARRDPHHLGNHLTLFWDDPGRVPPSLLLGAPRGRGIA